MTTTSQSKTEKQEDIDYYESRLRTTCALYRDGEFELLRRNKDKIRKLIAGYTQFKDNPNYDSALAGAVEIFILDV
jgi:hypothetical protein